MSATVTVRDCWGRERTAPLFPDGESWLCPFCAYGVVPSRAAATDLPCGNPGCAANQVANCDHGRAAHIGADHDAALIEQGARWRASVQASATARIMEDRITRANDYRARLAEATLRKACPVCATRDMYRPAKYICHRSLCPNSRERRTQ